VVVVLNRSNQRLLDEQRITCLLLTPPD
jgi:hypothetical protein